MRFPRFLLVWLALSSAAALSLAALPKVAQADDWPQWQGPTRNSVWKESGIVTTFPESGPKVVWRAPVAGGYAGPAVADGRVFVADFLRSAGEAKNDPGARPKLQGQERVHCLDAKSGKTLWKHAYDCNYEISYPAGPRATPTVAGDLVYTLGAEGNLHCLKVETGEVVWKLDINEKFSAPTPLWGFCSHPLVDGEKLFILAGGEGCVAVALNRRTGEEIWRALSATDAGYSPPTMIQVGERKQLVVWDPQSVNGLDPETGKVLWTEKLEPSYGMSINPPCQIGEHLFVSGIVNQGFLLKLSANQARPTVQWRVTPKQGIGPVHSPVVPVGNVLYGVDRFGDLTALDVPTGNRLWRTIKATTGERTANSATAFLVRNDDRFYVFSETGELIIAKLSPAAYEELARARILKPTQEAFGRNVIWSHPAFANRSIFARNDQEIVCVSLAKE